MKGYIYIACPKLANLSVNSERLIHPLYCKFKCMCIFRHTFKCQNIDNKYVNVISELFNVILNFDPTFPIFNKQFLYSISSESLCCPTANHVSQI